MSVATASTAAGESFKTKHDFTKRFVGAKVYCGFLEKKSSSGKTWKRRYFYMAEGLLKLVKSE
jgi:hypothetical protein